MSYPRSNGDPPLSLTVEPGLVDRRWQGPLPEAMTLGRICQHAIDPLSDLILRYKLKEC